MKKIASSCLSLMCVENSYECNTEGINKYCYPSYLCFVTTLFCLGFLLFAEDESLSDKFMCIYCNVI